MSDMDNRMVVVFLVGLAFGVAMVLLVGWPP